MSFLNELWWQIMIWHFCLWFNSWLNITELFQTNIEHKILHCRKYPTIPFWCLAFHVSDVTEELKLNSFLQQKFKPHPAHFSVFDLTFVGLRIVHGISNCPDMNCFVFCSNILCMNGSTGSGGGKKLRAGHVISVNNKTRHFFRFSSHQSLSSW